MYLEIIMLNKQINIYYGISVMSFEIRMILKIEF